MKFSGKTYYPDILVFLLLIPFISAFNYYLTYSNIRFNSFLLLSFSIDTSQGYLAWWMVRSCILYLDAKLPYTSAPLKRIVVQLPLTLFIGLFIISTTTELASWIVRGKSASLSFYTFDLFIISIWFFVINGIYTGLYYYNEWQNLLEQRKEEIRKTSGHLIAKQGLLDVKLRFEDLIGFFVDEEYVIACHTDGRKYYLNESLDRIEKKLPNSLFYRLNRQYILHHNMIAGFKRIENGKILVLLNKSDNFPSEIPVSRTKAASFKSWFHPE